MITPEQAQQVYGWARFKLSEIPRQYHFEGGRCVRDWIQRIQPDGYVSYGFLSKRGRLSPADLNNFEKWVLPKLVE